MKIHTNFPLHFSLQGPKTNITVVGTADAFEKSFISFEKLLPDLKFPKLQDVRGSQNAPVLAP